METGLRDRRVLVTGGSGGIGAACVRLFAAEGAEVVVHYHRGRERAEAAGGSRIVQADLRDEADVPRNPRTRVNAVAPGWTVSPMTERLLDDDHVNRISQTMALRKVATADDVAAQIVALASPVLSGHVSGQVVTVAGGMEGRVVHDGPITLEKKSGGPEAAA